MQELSSTVTVFEPELYTKLAEVMSLTVPAVVKLAEGSPAVGGQAGGVVVVVVDVVGAVA